LKKTIIKKVLLFLAITVLGTMANSVSFAQCNARHQSADIYKDQL